jgi:hypothetical protein
MSHDQHSTISFTAKDRSSMDLQINQAVEVLRAWGRQQRQGILVTRHTADSFSVQLSDAVPAGLTQETWNW